MVISYWQDCRHSVFYDENRSPTVSGGIVSEHHNLNQSKQKPAVNILLGTGIAFVLVGACLLGALSAEIDMRPSVFRHLVWAALGGCLLFAAIVRVRNKSVMFSGLFLTMMGILLFFIDTNYIPYTLEVLWPLVVVIGGLSLLVSGIYIHRGVRASYAIPSVALMLLGGCCLLFSMNIIQEPFLRLVSRWWPLALIATGLCLVVLFFVRNKHSIQMEDVDDDFNDLDDRN